MRLVPEFGLGLWNAWILMVPAFLVVILIIYVMIKKGAPEGKARTGNFPRATLIIASLSKIIFFPAVIISVFLPLQAGAWFYAGLPITLVGVAGTTAVLVA